MGMLYYLAKRSKSTRWLALGGLVALGLGGTLPLGLYAQTATEVPPASGAEAAESEDDDLNGLAFTPVSAITEDWPIVTNGAGETVLLPTVEVRASQVVESPVGTFEQPVSALRYEPRVDVQERLLPEAQADIAIRGGTFETTGLSIGLLPLYAPQTGHYLTELPVPVAMLRPLAVQTGFAHAASGGQAAVGSLATSWARVFSNTIRVSAGAGSDGLVRGEWYARQHWTRHENGGTLAVDAGAAYSEGDGPLRDSDHRFERYAARVQYRTRTSQTDFFGGYQAKFFGWPYLYALRQLHTAIGSSGAETENLQTRLWMVQHRHEPTDRLELSAAVAYRQHTDDYELDRYRPGLFNPYQHETAVWSGAVSLVARPWEGGQIAATANVIDDHLDSTALTFGPENDRRQVQGSLVLRQEFWEGFTTVAGGLRWDDSNRDGGTLAPLARLALNERGRWQLYAEVSGASQLPGYTGLKSNPNAGLFRGNPNLGRHEARNYEIGGQWQTSPVRLQATLFRREDDGLADWTFDPAITPFAARAARNLDLTTHGAELGLAGGCLFSPRYSWGPRDWALTYTWLDRENRSGLPPGAASFYGLNYARHRVNGSIVWAMGEALELRADLEWREQAANPLREGPSSALLGHATLSWELPQRLLPGDETRLTLGVANLANTSYQDVPGVPGTPRTWSIGLDWRW